MRCALAVLFRFAEVQSKGANGQSLPDLKVKLWQALAGGFSQHLAKRKTRTYVPLIVDTVHHLYSSWPMGVPGFNTWMRTQYVGAYVPQRSSFDHVYVDMASILHTVLRKGMQCYLACNFSDAAVSTLTFSSKGVTTAFRSVGVSTFLIYTSHYRLLRCRQQTVHGVKAVLLVCAPVESKLPPSLKRALSGLQRAT